MNGSFYFEEGEEGLRSINLEIYPPEDVEVQETYIIRLNVVKGETELDPKAASITLIVNYFIFVWLPTTVAFFCPANNVIKWKYVGNFKTCVSEKEVYPKINKFLSAY